MRFEFDNPKWKADEVMTLKSDLKEANNISFNAPDGVEMLKITPEGFYCLGQRVDDINNVYEKFSNWMKHIDQKERLIKEVLNLSFSDVQSKKGWTGLKETILDLIQERVEK